MLDEGGFLYSSDSYADDLPYWVNGPKGPHLIIPYTLDANDMRFINAQGFGNGDEFFAYLKDAFDVLYAEGERAPKMMSVGLHCRLVGTAGPRRRAHSFSRLRRGTRASLDCDAGSTSRGIGIASTGARRARLDDRLSTGMTTISLATLNAADQAAFVAALGDIYEHAPWVAQAAFTRRPFATLAALHEAMMEAVNAARRINGRALINGHPDLAGKAARAGTMTRDSKAEQASAGLDRLSDAEFAQFHRA